MRSGRAAAEARTGRWRTFGALLLAGVLGPLVLVPCQFALAPPRLPDGAPPLAVLLMSSLAQNAALLGVAIAVGLWLGPPVGPGAPLLGDPLLGVPGTRSRVRRFLAPAAASGAATALAGLALDVLVFAPRLPRGRPRRRARGGGPDAVESS